MWEDLDLAPLLTAVNGPLPGVTFRLGTGPRVIGRAEGADILVEDSKVSRVHATVERADGRVVLTDAGSTNGTWVNDRKISGPEELSDGDRIRVGNVTFHFFDPSSARTEPVATVGHLPSPHRPSLPTLKQTAGALGTPTQPMPTPRSGRVLLMLSGALALATWMAVAYLSF